jgi:hypothetical protein
MLKIIKINANPKKRKIIRRRKKIKSRKRKAMKRRKVIRAKRNPSTEAHELYLFGVNDGRLYRNSAVPIMINLAKKIKKGTYDKTLALKLWKYHADRAAQAYVKEFGGNWHTMFSINARKEAAKEFQDHYEDELRDTFNKNPKRKKKLRTRRKILRVKRNRASMGSSRSVIAGIFLPRKGFQKTVYFNGQGFTLNRGQAKTYSSTEAQSEAKRILPMLPPKIDRIWTQVA